MRHSQECERDDKTNCASASCPLSRVSRCCCFIWHSKPAEASMAAATDDRTRFAGRESIHLRTLLRRRFGFRRYYGEVRMGQTFRFRCTRCGLTSDVSGGPDRGMIAHTQTMWCGECKTLQDVEIGSEFFSEEDSQNARNGNFRCYSCGGISLSEWRAGNPCPDCSGNLRDTGEIVEFWD